jgi:predicted flap endonuclease-1-like 5' DNA nuclease
MHYLALQIGIFIIAAIVTGIAFGWWLKSLFNKGQEAENKLALTNTRRNLQDAHEEITALKTRYQDAQQKIDKYTRHFNSDTYGDYLETRKSLEKSRKEKDQIATELSKKQLEISKLQSELEQIRKLVDLQSVRATEIIDSKLKQLTQNQQKALPTVDDLKQIPEINGRLENTLNAFGIMSFRKLTELSKEDASQLARVMGHKEFPHYQTIIEKARSLCGESFSSKVA